ncbi:cyclin-domain-containing protein [Gloeopeniophorella convolvens]|nr:cyclin-domain-containing protein [Gloeopeniophorella convolvens]
MESAGRVGLPSAYEDADIDALCQLIALMLDRLISINDRIPLSPESISRFHSASVPQISILDYLRRIVRFTNLEKTCLLIILHYIDQICARTPSFTISSLTAHRFIIAAAALASKTLCDAFCTNAHYARVLQVYYVSLVAHSGGRFYVAQEEAAAAAAAPSPANESDSGASASASADGGSSPPAAAGPPPPPPPGVAPAPSVEQNMAYAQFQFRQQRQGP